MNTARKLTLFSAAILLGACTSRPSSWDATLGQPQVVGLDDSVALIDDETHRAILLHAGVDQTLTREAFSIGHHVVHVDVSADKKTLFVLSAGDTPRKSDKDEFPTLTVVSHSGAAGTPYTTKRFPLATPLSSLALDPLGKWAAVYAGDSQHATFVENPNEIVFVDLQAGPGQDQPIDRTLRSFGGTPQRLTFSPTLQLPSGPRRLLVVETDQDVSLLDLDHLHDATQRPDHRAPHQRRLTRHAHPGRSRDR